MRRTHRTRPMVPATSRGLGHPQRGHFSSSAAAYAAVFIGHGRAPEAAITTVFTLAVGVGLAAELRTPQAAEQRTLGWEHDERQRLIRLHAAASPATSRPARP